MFKHIILAVDGSESSGRALEMAANMARTFGSSVTVVQAYDPVPIWLGEPDYRTRVEENIARGESIAEAAEGRLRDRGVTEIELDVLQGPAVEAIVNAAAVRQADLIVMGSRGLTPLKGLLLGSVSERVIGAAPCPVLVVR